MLLVHSAQHCRLEDIDSEGNWVRDVEFESSEGPIKYTKGESAHNKLGAFVKARSASVDAGYDKTLRVWGQPNAWANALVCKWLAELFEEVYGQCLVFADALSARWGAPSVLEHWSRNLFLTPYAPGSTYGLQEPDTHQHSQLRAELREKKAELFADYEALDKREGKG